MTTVDINSLNVDRPISVCDNSTGFYYSEIPVANIPTQGPDSVSSVAVTGAGSGYTAIPSVSFTGGGGSGAASFASMKTLSATIVGPGTNISPGNTGTFVGGTFTTAAIATVTNTCVGAASVAAAGTGGTPGTQTVTGTTGTGTKFQASVTINGGGVVTAVNSITVAGNYTVNPSDVAHEPVTGAGLTGAQLHVIMGALTVSITTPGRYTVLPTAPVSTSAVFSVTPTYGVDIVTVTDGGIDYVTAPAVAFSSGAATATATLATAGDPISVDLVFSDVLPTDTYTVVGTPNQPGVVSQSNKTTAGCTLTLTPLDGETLTSGLMDAVIKLTA